MKNLQLLPHTNILFIDIETAPIVSSFEQLNAAMQDHWERKFAYLNTKGNYDAKEGFLKHAGIYAEFSKIICISVGRFKIENDQTVLSVKSISNDDEQKLLQNFSDILQRNKLFKSICGHNIKEFDVPFICRRMMVNQIELPELFDLSGKKSYEVNHLIDTLQLWKFADYKHYTSLALLTEIMGIETPKTDMEGKDVAMVYWHDNNLTRIAKYCMQDVVAVAQLFLKLSLQPLLKPEQIIFQ